MPIVTISIIIICTAIFLIDLLLSYKAKIPEKKLSYLLEGNPEGKVFGALALNTNDVKKGQIWRVVTSMFLHTGFPHIAFNLLTLYAVGSVVEPIIGVWKTIVIYIFSGIFSALCIMRIIKLEGGNGASAAIIGLIGALLILFVQDAALLADVGSIWKWIVICIMMASNFVVDSVVQTEHMGGFVGGILLTPLLVVFL